MKILCEAQVVNRKLPHLVTRSVKSTLAIGFHPAGKENSELFIMHFTAQNPNGTRYKIKQNLLRIYTKYINDGKATISFVVPEHNVQIKCNPLQLKCFLQSLKLGLQGKNEINKLGMSSLATSAISPKLHPVRSLVIARRADFPVKGIPKSVERLTISGIERTKLDQQILSLTYLTYLNLSDNRITALPVEFGMLNLKEIDLSRNILGQSKNVRDWDWLEGIGLQKSLIMLNMSENKIPYFPYKIVKLGNLVTLRLSDNLIKSLPFSIRRLTNLRFFYISSNELESLPNSINLLHLETLDVWSNKFLIQPEKNQEIAASVKGIAPTLLESAARSVIANKIPYTERIIPRLLVDMLLERPMCHCGKICFSARVFPRAAIITLEHVKNLVFSRDLIIYHDCVVCSEKCARKLKLTGSNL